LVNQGEFGQAEALLRKLAGKRLTGANLAYLADIQARAGNLQDAEANYRTVLGHSPRNAQALGGLAGVLAREGKQDEADTLFAQAAKLPGGASAGAAHADALRLQAEQMTDPVAQIGMFRAAIQADPSNPWLRLDMARALHSQGNDAEAHEIMAPVGRGPHPTKDQLQAAIYFYNEMHDYAQVTTLVDRLSRHDQTPQMIAIQTNARVREEVREARALGSRIAERDRLLTLVSEPDPSGLRVTTIGQELIRIGDKAAAREAVRLSLASHPATPEERVAYGGVLLGAGYPDDARRVTQLVNPTTGVMTYQLSQVRDGAAVEASDKLNAAGDPAAAYDQLAPRLAASPENTDLKLALARLYTSNQLPRKAEQLTQDLLQQNPNNLSVRSTAVYAAMAAGNYGQAASIAEESTAQFPDEPQAWFDLGNVERARGNTGRALRALQTAKQLREKQLSTQDSPSGSAERDNKGPGTASIEPLHRRYAQYAQYIPLNTASDVSPSALPEPVTRQYAQYAPTALPPIEGGPATSPYVSGGYAPFNPGNPASLSAPPSAFATSPALAPPSRSVQTQNSQLLTAPGQGNPFHPGSSPAPTIDEPTVPGGSDGNRPLDLTPTDAMTAQIDQGIQQLQQEVAPRLDASVYVRGRTGTDGFGKLIELGAPLEASYSPAGEGRLKVVVTPTYLYSGKSTDTGNISQFGTNPLGGIAGGPVAAAIRNQTAFGTGFDVGYAYDIVTADVGASPFGFREENVLGGVEIAPKLTDTITLRLLFERRMVTDSLLAYAGTKDVRTGETWGGVTRNRGHLQVDGTAGLFNWFAGAGGAYYEGDKVASNTEIDAAIGATYPVWHDATQEVRVGAEAIYFGFNKNLGGFTLGQGGYFSPQNYEAILFPVTWRNQVTPDLRFTLGGSVGFQHFDEKSSAVFPDNDALQAQLVSLSSTTGAVTRLSGGHASGVAGGVNGEIDYRVNTNLHIGARAGFDHSGDFSEGTGLVYARYVFDDSL
jgi:tetratricopeptide (TPR) repeat protein